LPDQPLAHQLVIGIGNPLRGDDGVGALLAEQAGGRTVHQLTPELAADLAPLRRVLFIDAWLAPQSAGPTPLPRLDPLPAAVRPGDAGSSHRLDPAELLAITAALYGQAPSGSWLRVPAFAFGHGSDLSEPLRASLPQARRLLRQWLKECSADA
jgi:hydrogenase maturation protease